MNIDDRKKILTEALIESFVEEYKAYKNTVNMINLDLKDYNIFYTYDEFCVDFLNQSIKTLTEVDIFSFNEYDDFYKNLWKFNLYNLQLMLSNRLNVLGYDDIYSDNKIVDKPHKL